MQTVCLISYFRSLYSQQKLCMLISDYRVENFLTREDKFQRARMVYPYHGAIDVNARQENLQEFSRPLLPKPVVLISTDRASRGIDFNSANIGHVILFDFPQEPSEYLRRIGRTGRAGRAGKATVLVYGKQVSKSYCS